MIIPSYKLRGETATLECQYELNGPYKSIELIDSFERVASSRQQSSIVNIYNNDTNDHNYDNYLYNRDENEQQYLNQLYLRVSDEKVSNYNNHQNNSGRSNDNELHTFSIPIQDHGNHINDKSSKNNYNNNNSRHRLHKHANIISNSGVEQSHSHRSDNGGFVNEEALYSVKWYRDNEEFYRYTPKESPPQQTYNVDGINVAVSSF